MANIHEIIYSWETGKLPQDLDALMAIQYKVDDYYEKALAGQAKSSRSPVIKMYEAECIVYGFISAEINVLVDQLIPEPVERHPVERHPVEKGGAL